MSEPILELRNVVKHFGSRRAPIVALAGVSLSLDVGETLGVVGESGSGKSTVARIAVGLETPTEGMAFVMGREVRPGTSSGGVQMVFQDPASSLDPTMRISQSVREPLDALRVTPAGERLGRALQALAEVGLGHGGSRYPGALSGGQKQRASIARALAALPPVIICDEAVTSLDVSIRAQILNLLRQAQDDYGVACLFISHDLCTVSYMSHRIAVMYLGKIVEIGERDQLFAAPAHPYTYALLSAIPRLQQGSRKRLLVRLKGEPPSVVNPPSGCRFHTRCPLADEKCKVEEPALRQMQNGHFAACHYAPIDESGLARAVSGGGRAS